MPKTGFVRVWIGDVFPEWSSTRMARWLKVNPRTIQRWMTTSDGQISDDEVPPALRFKMQAQAQKVADCELGRQIDDFIERMQKNGIDDEVLAAWLAHRYRKLINREID